MPETGTAGLPATGDRRPLRILYISQWFEPEPILKGVDFVRGLEALGHEVEAVAGFPNYPAGKLYPGYRQRLHQRDEIGGITVHRLPLYPSHGRSSVGRALNFLSFATSAALYGLLRARRFDVLYVYPPLPVALAAALICVVRRRPFVMDVQDLWPDSVVRSDMPGTRWMERILTPMCNFAYRRATLIVAQSQGIARRLVERGVPEDKLRVVYNWAHADRPGGKVDLEQYGFAGRFNVVYGGNLGIMQGLDTLIRATLLAARDVPRLQLLLIGNGADRERLEALVDELGGHNHVRIGTPLPRDQIADVFAAADVLALHLVRDPLFAITVPHKTQSYMAAGRPILAAVEGEAARLVTEAGAGIAAEPGNVEAIAAAMVRLARMPPHELQAMADAGRRAFRDRFTLAAAMDATDAAIQQASRRQAGKPRA